MKTTIYKRILALSLCICLLFASSAIAQEEDLAVTRSDFTLSTQLHADAFPATTDAHMEDWETFLSKLSLSGTVDVQDFLSPTSRVFFDGALTLNGEDTLPFVYDGYHSYRYIRTIALGGASMHFQMHNFFDFMMKPFYYMGLSTNYLALLMYPEAATFVYDSYSEALLSVFDGEGSRQISYNELYSLCETLNLIMTDDGLYRRAYRFFNMVFAEFYTGQIAYSMMSQFELYLEALDPDKQGMTITSENGHETYVIGTTTLMERTFTEESETITLTFPETEGYELFINYQSILTEDGQNIEAQFLLYEDQEERYNVRAVANGLPVEDQIVADGNVTFTFSGNAWRDVPSPISLTFHYDRTQVALPYDMTFTLDWIHPETQISGFTLQYEASMQDMPSDTLVEQIYDNQNDFFSLNEGFVDEYTERFKAPLALSLLPFVLEMPSGVIDDLFVFLDSTSILAILGLE